MNQDINNKNKKESKPNYHLLSRGELIEYLNVAGIQLPEKKLTKPEMIELLEKTFE